MIKEEFIDKIAVANKSIGNIKAMVEKMEQTKREAVAVYLETNMKLDPGQRVRVYQNEDPNSIENKEFIGYGYVRGALVDEDYGIILYPLVKEDKKTKEPSEERFESELGVIFEDFEHCNTLIEIA